MLLILSLFGSVLGSVNRLQYHSVKFPSHGQSVFDNFEPQQFKQQDLYTQGCQAQRAESKWVLISCDSFYYVFDPAVLEHVNQTIIPQFWAHLDATNQYVVLAVSLSADLLTTVFLDTELSQKYPLYPQVRQVSNYIINFRFLGAKTFNSTLFMSWQQRIILRTSQIDDLSYLIAVVGQDQTKKISINLGVAMPDRYYSQTIQPQSECMLQDVGIYQNQFAKGVILMIVCQTNIHVYFLDVNRWGISGIRQLGTFEAGELLFEQDPKEIVSTQLVEDLMLIQYPDKSILYKIKPISYDLEVIHTFYTSQNLLIMTPQIENLRCIIMASNDTSQIVEYYAVYKTNTWYKTLNVKLAKVIQTSAIPISYILMDSIIYLQYNSRRHSELSLQSLCVQGTKAQIQIANNLIYTTQCIKCDQQKYPGSSLDKLEGYEPFNYMNCVHNCSQINQEALNYSKPDKLSANLGFQFCANAQQQPTLDLSNINIKIQSRNDFIISQLGQLERKYKDYMGVFKTPYQLESELKSMNVNRSFINITSSTVKQCESIFYHENQIFNQIFNQSITMQTIENECILSGLEEDFTQVCKVQYSNCQECAMNPWCKWEYNQCHSRDSTPRYQNTPLFNSKWFYRELIECPRPIVCSRNNWSVTDQEGILKLDQINEYVSVHQNQICTWFVDIPVSERFTVMLKIGDSFVFHKENITVDLSVCLMENSNQTTPCGLFPMGKELQNGKSREYLQESSSFRVVLMFLEESVINPSQFEIHYTKYQPQTEFYRRKHNIILFIMWLVFTLLLLITVCYITRRRIQHMIGHAFELELGMAAVDRIQIVLQNQNPKIDDELPLSSARLQRRMQELLDEGVIAKYPFDDLLTIYGQGNCSFCLEEYDISDVLVQFFCGHLFHSNCFESWARSKTHIEKCPVCNQRISEYMTNKHLYKPLTSVLHKSIDISR